VTHPSDAETPLGEHAAVRRAFDSTCDDSDRRVLVWRPAPQVAFGRRDENAATYDEARAAARDAGYTTTVRNAGGRAVVHAGETVAFAVAAPVDDPRAGLRDRYDDAVCTTREALESLGVDARCGEPDASFCPGEASLCIEDGKVAGIAQRVSRDAALVSGVVIVRKADETARVLSSVYEALGVPFRAESVGSVAVSSPAVTAESVADALAEAFDP